MWENDRFTAISTNPELKKEIEEKDLELAQIESSIQGTKAERISFLIKDYEKFDRVYYRGLKVANESVSEVLPQTRIWSCDGICNEEY